MQRDLPTAVDFLQQSENRREYEGLLQVADLERLHELLADTEGEVEVKLRFGRKYEIPSLSGSVRTELGLTCQRCLQPMKTRIESSFCFALITDEDEIEDLPDDMEPYIVEGEKQSVIDVIVDEILLSVPLVAKHEEACSDYLSGQGEADVGETHKPFAGIKDLLN